MMFKKKNYQENNATICDVTMQTLSDSVNSKLSIQWAPDQNWGPKRDLKF